MDLVPVFPNMLLFKLTFPMDSRMNSFPAFDICNLHNPKTPIP